MENDFYKNYEKIVGDLSLEEQIEQEKPYATYDIAEEAQKRNAVDVLVGATGEFGKMASNPIPVNGVGGEFTYLSVIRCKICGRGLLFHRLGSTSENINNKSEIIDIYEVCCYEGCTREKLYFDRYFPRRSTIIPKRYKLMDLSKSPEKFFFLLPICLGTYSRIENFPFGLEDEIEKYYIGKIENPSLYRNWIERYKNTVTYLEKKFIHQKTILTSHDISRLNFYFKNGKLKEASDFLQEKYKENPDDTGVLYHSGYLFRLQGNYDEALKAYKKVYALIGYDRDTIFGMGIAYQLKGEYTPAISFLEKAIEIDPNFPQALNSLALTYKKVGDFSNSLKYYNQSIEVLFQDIYDEIKKKPLKEIDNRYAEINSEKWREVATQIAVKNGAKDGIKNVRLPTGETATKSLEENPFMGVALHDDSGTRYILPAYFSTFYTSLRSNLLYSTILNNIGTLFAEHGDKEQARKCYMESIEFIPHGVNFNDPTIGLREIND